MAKEVKFECSNARQILDALGLDIELTDDVIHMPLGKVSYRAKVDLSGQVAVVELEVINACDELTFSLGAGHTIVQAVTYAYQAAEYQANPPTW